MLENTIIVDGRDHLLGRLASIVSKELLSGQKVVIVRCDEVCVSGSREFPIGMSMSGFWFLSYLLIIVRL